ncbi:MAG: Lrp/AsnC family transcriptional regulator [Nitrosopumilaceae archaeon]
MLRTPEEQYVYAGRQAYVMINCEDGAQEYVIGELKSLEYVKEIASTFGSYDIVAKITVPSVECLRETITFKIRRIPKIRTTTTIICMPSTSFFDSSDDGMRYV